MKQSFDSKQEALEYKNKHQLFGRVPERTVGTNKWVLNFPVSAHVTVCQPHGPTASEASVRANQEQLIAA